MNIQKHVLITLPRLARDKVNHQPLIHSINRNSSKEPKNTLTHVSKTKDSNPFTQTIFFFMWPLRCPKSSAAATAISGAGNSRSCNLCCLVTKLMRKLKSHRRRTKSLRSSTRQGPLQCRYDPLSYSLNFDDGGRSGSGNGSVLDDNEDCYYKFYAFTSRFVVAANVPKRSSSCPIVPVVEAVSQ